MEIGFIARLVLLTSVVVALFVYFGAKASRHVAKNAPDSEFNVRITLSGTALFASVVGFWLICVIARSQESQGALGNILSTLNGFTAVIFASIFVVAVCAAILEKVGYPIIERDKRGT